MTLSKHHSCFRWLCITTLPVMNSSLCIGVAQELLLASKHHPAQTRQILRKLLPNCRVWREVRGDEKRYEGKAAVDRFSSRLVRVNKSDVLNGDLKAIAQSDFKALYASSHRTSFHRHPQSC